MQNEMDYSLIQRTPDGTGKILVTIPGSPDKGSYVLEADLKIYTNQGMVAIADIVDDLVTADATKPLSANQGVVLKQLIDAVSGGITPKGDILSTNLPAADDSNKGWQYYCTDLNKYATSDGTQWVYTSNSQIVQTPDATDTGHALSNAVVTQKCNAVEATLNQHDARLQNLEQKAGDYSIVQYRGTDAVPTGKAHYGLVKNIVGKTRAWNQVIKTQTVATTGLFNGVTFTNEDGYVNANGTCSATITTQYFDRTNLSTNTVGGHVYLLFGCATGGDSSKYYLEPLIGSGANYAYGRPMDFGSGVIFTAKDSNGNNGYVYGVRLVIQNGVSVNANFRCYLRDLTLIFGSGNEPSTVADALAQLPALGEYNAYDAGSLVSTTVEGVESVGVNIWDEVWESGEYNASTGAKTPNADYMRNVNLIPVLPATQYYLKCPIAISAYYFDINKQKIGTSAPTLNANAQFTTDANAYYMAFAINKNNYGGLPYKHDIQICLNSYADKTTYHPYKTDSLSFSETVTLRSAGSVADELDVESGVVTRNVGSVDMGSLSWVAGQRAGGFTAILARKDYAGPMISSLYSFLDSNFGWSNFNTYPDKIIAYNKNSQNTIYVKNMSYSESSADAFKTAMSGVYLYYELATPTTESIDPITDNFIEVEGGGTINTIQEQTPVIDNSLDVGYLTV